MSKYDYDAVIIGAGISGLVCGCYLAKAGLKTLIVEKNHQAGGYCVSFVKQGVCYDTYAHFSGGFGKGGNMSKIIKELKIEKDIKPKRCDPSDIICVAKNQIRIWNDLEKTIDEFQNSFPSESENLRKFFRFIEKIKNNDFNSLRRITFQKFLDKYFTDRELKGALSLLIYGNSGVPPSKVSALTAITIYKQFVLDGGYYFEQGIQELPNRFSERYMNSGGELLLNSLVKKIIVDEMNVKSIVLRNGKIITSRYIVSAADLKQTYLNLIGKKYLRKDFIKTLNAMTPTLSTFILYMGVDKSTKMPFPSFANIWIFSDFNLERAYKLAQKGGIKKLDYFLVHISKDKNGITALAYSSFKDNKYWKLKKSEFTDIFISKIGRAIPGLLKNASIRGVATPQVLHASTMNYKGSSFGWESTLSQFAIGGLSLTTPINNLYTTGHWTTLTQGITGVAYLGRATAQLVLAKEKIRNKK